MVRFIHPTDDKKDVVGKKPPKMQVLALGLSRCGTSSLQAALESDVIGAGPSMHMAHIAPYADQEVLVLDAMAASEALQSVRRSSANSTTGTAQAAISRGGYSPPT